jgi:hypothetical protein
MTTNYTKWPQIIPNGRKIHIPNGHKIYQHFPTQGPPKFTLFEIFVLKKTIWQPCLSARVKMWLQEEFFFSPLR